MRQRKTDLLAGTSGIPAGALDRCPGAATQFRGLPHLRISTGDVRASAEPMLMKTLLGSCIAVCLYDTASGAGGMNHIFLPGDASGGHTIYGVHAMELLINQLMQLGCTRDRMLAKAFGGANVLDCIKSPTIGEKNAEFVRQFLADERIPLHSCRLGGSSAMEVRFRTDTGYVLLRTLNAARSRAVERDDANGTIAFRNRIHDAEEDRVTLF